MMSRQPDLRSAPPGSANPKPEEYSNEERRILLQLAHRAIEAALKEMRIDTTPPTPHLAERRGAFTTLHLNGQLRGCVGYIVPAYSVYQSVAETAMAAAFEDSRFDAVTPEEAKSLEIEISILSLPRPIEASEIEIGRHGLIVSQGTRRGLLLPQVPVEHDWDRLTFLEQTCFKAGLPLNAWEHGARLEAFTAEVFNDTEYKP